MSQKIEVVPPKKRNPPKPVTKKGVGNVTRFRQALSTVVSLSDLMDGNIREINIEEDIFGVPHTDRIGIDDMNEILLDDMMIGGYNLHAYIR